MARASTPWDLAPTNYTWGTTRNLGHGTTSAAGPYKVNALYPTVHTLPEGRMVMVAQGWEADATLDEDDGRRNG
jgi:hypothetical protein